MNKENVSFLVQQIRNIILNKPLTEDLKVDSEELAELQGAILYLAECLEESNEFLKHLRMGNLDVTPPSRHNFQAGSLKEIHSALRHLTWQANQVANGDYNQRVDFLGDFSTSFNQMINQLAEREAQLKLQTTMLAETVDLMKSVMDGLNDWIVVIAKDNGEVIYTNQSARQYFYNVDSVQLIDENYSELLEYMKQYKQSSNESSVFEYKCDSKFFQIHSYSIQWNDKLAYAHYIEDVTSEKEYQEQIEGLAYTDELTELYNRRFCLENLDKLLEQGAEFTFCMIDLDGLKYANDTFGHIAGDEYLRFVAREMLRITCSTDMVCRIGGDEFAILLPNTDEQTALDKMEQFDKAITMSSKEYPMSASYGAVHIDAGVTSSAETIMEQADEKMYIMKNKRKAAKSIKKET